MMQSGTLLVAYLWVALALNYVDRQMVYSIFPALRSELGFSETQLGLIGSVFTWVYALGMPIAGRLSDRLRQDRMIVASMVLWSAATLACGLSTSVGMFLFFRAVMGITEALYYPAAVAMIAGVHTGPTRSRALGTHQSAQLIGIIVGGSYGGWMADHWGWRTGFGIAAGAGVLYALVLLRQLPAARAVKVEQHEGSIGEGLRSLWTSRYVALAAAFFAFCSMLWVFYAWFPSFLNERYKLSMTASGFNATVFLQLSAWAGVLLGGTLADWLTKRVPAGRFYIAAAGVGLSAPFGYLTFAAETLEMTKIFAMVYGAFSGLMIGNTFAAAVDVVPKRHYGLGAGILNMVGGIAGAILILLAGMLKGTIGFAGLLQYVALGCVVTALGLVWAGKRAWNPV